MYAAIVSRHSPALWALLCGSSCLRSDSPPRPSFIALAVMATGTRFWHRSDVCACIRFVAQYRPAPAFLYPSGSCSVVKFSGEAENFSTPSLPFSAVSTSALCSKASRLSAYSCKYSAQHIRCSPECSGHSTFYLRGSSRLFVSKVALGSFKARYSVPLPGSPLHGYLNVHKGDYLFCYGHSQSRALIGAGVRQSSRVA